MRNPGLTEREIEVLRAIAEGHTRTSGAEALHMAVGTYRTHTENVLLKLQAKNAPNAVAIGYELGLLGDVFAMFAEGEGMKQGATEVAPWGDAQAATRTSTGRIAECSGRWW